MGEVERNEKMRLRTLNGIGATRTQNVNIWQTWVSWVFCRDASRANLRSEEEKSERITRIKLSHLKAKDFMENAY